MFKLLDRAFFRALLGFLVILAVSFSVLILVNAYRDVGEHYAALLQALSEAKHDASR